MWKTVDVVWQINCHTLTWGEMAIDKPGNVLENIVVLDCVTTEEHGFRAIVHNMKEGLTAT